MNQPSHPTPAAGGAMNEQVKTAVNSHRVKLRVLTSTAFIFGFVAVAASIAIVWSYLILYLPKQREMIDESQAVVTRAQTKPESAEESIKRIDNYLSTHIVLTHVVSLGVALVGLAVGVLGLGTLLLLMVIILNRRVALNQINISLGQISSQLRELQNARGSP